MIELTDLRGTHWSGRAELWLDPLGNDAQQSDCTLSIGTDVIRYTWQYEGKPQAGAIELSADGASFSDTWHQPQPMTCARVPGRGLIQVQGAYGPDGDWGWRIALLLRPHSNELVLQMTNVTPWGEEGRAVRMISKRVVSA